MFSIYQLQLHIPPEIYKRGLDYFQQQCVDSLYEDQKGIWRATVTGTEDYTVRIQLKDNTLVKAACSCPHDAEICKHIAATVLAILEEKPGKADAVKSSASKKGKAVNEKSTKVPGTKELIEKLPKEELQQLVLRYAAQSKDFKNYLAIQLLAKAEPASKANYLQLIQQAVKPYKKRGFIDYYSAPKAVKLLYQLADNAAAQLQKGFYREAVDISQALIESLPAVAESMDDSDGHISSLNNAAFETLADVIAADAPFLLKEEIFEYALLERKKSKYKDWDWPEDFFELAIVAASQQEHYQKLLQVIEEGLRATETVKDNWHITYKRQEWLQFKIEVLQKMGRPEEAGKILDQHLEIPAFRQRKAKQLMQEGKWAEAARVCEEAVRLKVPHVVEWYRMLLYIAQQQADTASIRRWGSTLFLQSNHSLEVFSIYKATFSEEEWPAAREKLFAAVQKQGNQYYRIPLAHLYVEEKLWEDLLQEFTSAADFNYLIKYDKYLLPRYTIQVLTTYQRAIIQLLENYQGRNYYASVRKVCSYLQQVEGGEAFVQNLLNELRRAFGKRRALMEELDKLVL